jgi:rhamnulokinase
MMRDAMKFVAVDLGASSGRLMVGAWDGRRFSLEELHRFPNGGVSVRGSIEWDVLRLWQEIIDGADEVQGAVWGFAGGDWGGCVGG